MVREIDNYNLRRKKAVVEISSIQIIFVATQGDYFPSEGAISFGTVCVT